MTRLFMDGPEGDEQQQARTVMIGFRVSPEIARLIRQSARQNGRTVSAFLAFFL